MNYYHRSNSGSSQTSAERPNGQGGGFALSEDEQMDLASQLMELESEAEFELRDGRRDVDAFKGRAGRRRLRELAHRPASEAGGEASPSGHYRGCGRQSRRTVGAFRQETGGQFLSDQMEAEAEARARLGKGERLRARHPRRPRHAAGAPPDAHPYEAALAPSPKRCGGTHRTAYGLDHTGPEAAPGCATPEAGSHGDHSSFMGSDSDDDPRFACWMLEQEARALLTRLALVRPLVLVGPMVPAAGLLPEPHSPSNSSERGEAGPARVDPPLPAPARSQEGPVASAGGGAVAVGDRFRLRFQRVLTHFDLFENVIAQRSDAQRACGCRAGQYRRRRAAPARRIFRAAADRLLPRSWHGRVDPAGAYPASRRGTDPVAIVKIPRERLVGNGIASRSSTRWATRRRRCSGLWIDCVGSCARSRGSAERRGLAPLGPLDFRIVADLWSVARRESARPGLIGVVSLPRPFVFRSPDDPHPAPHIRVKLSAAFGEAFYPQPAWGRLIELWDCYFPTARLDRAQRQLFADLEANIPALVDAILPTPAGAQGRYAAQALDTEELQPARLRQLLQNWREGRRHVPLPAVVTFATIGQGRADGMLTPEEESTVITKLLTSGH